MSSTKSFPSLSRGRTMLPEDFQPSARDVICCRGRKAYDHNRFFRDIIKAHMDKYNNAGSKVEKTLVVTSVVDAVREGSPSGGGFVRCIANTWYEVGDDVAREKVGHSFREMLHTKYRSSNEAKRRRRDEEEAKEAEEETATAIFPLIAQSSSLEPASKRFRMEETVSSTGLRSAERLCSFGALLSDIASRKQQLEQSPIVPPSKLATKSPTLPPPLSFPAAPKSPIMRGCSMESILTFDVGDMAEDILDVNGRDAFEAALERFSSISSSVSIVSFETGTF